MREVAKTRNCFLSLGVIVERNQIDRSDYRARPVILFRKGIFEIPVNRHVCDRATKPAAPHRHDNTFAAASPIRATVPGQECPLFVGTTRSPTTRKRKRENNAR